MKVLILLLAAGSLLVACKKEKAAPAAPLPDETAMLQYRGTFSNGPYGSTMGVVKIYSEAGRYSLVLDSFTVSSGPDLHVYLSKEVQPLNFIDLGVLRSNSGLQAYEIAGMPDFMEYKYALIHCQQFDHLFGSADLR